MKQSLRTKLINYAFDALMFIVPILELTELMTLIPPEYLPVYMLGTVLARRALRLLEEYLASKSVS